MIDEKGTNRIEWIDVLKGGLFILVVLSHIPNKPNGIERLLNDFAILRMPCYFFISGYLFSTRRLNTFKSFF